MARRKSLRSQLYRAARDMGNVEAAEHGFERGGVTGAVAGEGRRYARRAVYRKSNSLTGSLLKGLGLGGRR